MENRENVRSETDIKTRFFLVTIGTLGDLVPFLALADELAKKGFSVTLLSNENWRILSGKHDLPFVAIAPPEPAQNKRKDKAFFSKGIAPSFQASHDYIMEQVAEDDVVIYRAGMVGAVAACRKRGLRSIRVFLQPGSVPSLLSPPWPMCEWLARIRSERVRAVVLRRVMKLHFRFGSQVRLIRKFMRDVQVPYGVDAVLEDQTPSVYLFPKWFGRPAPDWPRNSVFAGFLFEPARIRAHLDESKGTLERYRRLASTKGPPIVFTSGTGYIEDEASIETAREFCRRTGSPGVFISRKSVDVASRFEDDDFIAFDHLDLVEALPLARCLIHHGGIGTLAKALHAGIPQIIRPFAYDQPDNAWRVMTSGLGAGVAKRAFSADMLVNSLAYVESEPVRHRIGLAAQQVRKTDAQRILLSAVMQVAGVEEGRREAA